MKVKSESEVAQSCPTPSLETPMDGGAWYTTVHGVTKSRTQLSNFTLTFTFFQALKEKKMIITLEEDCFLNITTEEWFIFGNSKHDLFPRLHPKY